MLNGGITINTETGDQPNKGYAVAIKEEMRIPKTMSFDNMAICLAAFKQTNERVLMSRSSIHLGAWVEPDHICFDVSQVLSDEKVAREVARIRNQKAYQDLSIPGEAGTIYL